MGTALNIGWHDVDKMDWSEFRYVVDKLEDLRQQEKAIMSKK